MGPVGPVEPVEPVGDHRRGPRRRGATLESAILNAALEELAEVGYAGLTMERVASRARTGKAALYRRWSSRAELAVDAWAALRSREADPPDTGDLRGDVVAVLRHLSESMAGTHGDILRGLLTEIVRDPEFARTVRERTSTLGPGAIQCALGRAAERGEIQSWVLTSRRATVAVELLRSHYLLHGTPVPDDVIAEIVDEVYLPLLLAPKGNAEPKAE
ncbi:TetR/AcrR family transcriptional regulator [Streptomyces sp. NPDC048172]|uniref:TetR/AcrR family transcriptional regulator n=1 Tax=Streptomyces sp. NPDC048172 TaxID=3365505 RepID=UPI00371B1876